MSDPYAITKTLSESPQVSLYRGVRRTDNLPVIIKALSTKTSLPREIERLRHEYEITQRIDSPCLLKPYELDRQKTQARLILEDFDGEPLSGQIGRPLETGQFLDIARQLVMALADIHRQDILHKDLKPDNILVQSRTGTVKLTGFGIATRMVHAPTTPPIVNLIEGSLAYMSPEQTGRMNRGVDHRSDLYSLGVIFYRMLTGELPFQATDPLEWVHCHIARQPRTPTEIVPAIPGTLTAIVEKLLAKQAEERYQSAYGLQRDLERCQEQMAARGKIKFFPPGKQDASDRFLISSRLYGREKEVAALLKNFMEVAVTGQARFALVSGYSGIGKSSLVRELHRPVVAARGYFIAGKFDRYQRDIPYATITQAFHNLFQQILTESDERIQSWKTALEEALEANGRLITDLIPQLELIIGPQPPVPELSPTEAQRRFHMMFHRFVGVFAQKEHPLVLFLDDLQWLDPASLKLITYLVTHPDSGSLFLIGAYRDNEVSPSHPLMQTLNEVRRNDIVLQELVLGPLSLTHLKQLLADTLHRPLKVVAPLARLVYDKTAGNPFFSIHFLTTLYRKGLLTYDRQYQYWQWELQKIRKQNITDNVVQLMLDKLKHFKASIQQVLMLTACLGNTAEIHALALLCKQAEEKLHPALQEAIDEGLMWRMNGTYKFLHDRVQEAAYALLPVDDRPRQHLHIGRLLLSHTPEDRLAENIFEIVGHLNRGVSLITAQDERQRLAELNLMAGKRAKASMAYLSALAYFTVGTELLSVDCWEQRHELAYSLEINRAECEFLTGDHESTERRLTVILEHAADTVEQAAVACLRIDLYTTLGQSNRAVAAGLDFLQHLGINCRWNPSQPEVRREYERIKETLNSHSIEELLDLPLMSNPETLATVEVMTKTWPPALFTDANLASMIICKAVSLSLEWGNCDASCFAYELLGRIAGQSFGDYQDGFRFGQLGYELVERHGLKRFKARTYLCFSNSIVPWIKHVQVCHDMQLLALEAANRAGDLLYEAFACNSLNTDHLFAGTPLPQVQDEVEQRLAFVEKARFGLVFDSISAQLALIRTLRGLTFKFGSFDHRQFNELRTEHHYSSNPALAIAACRYWIRKLQARYIAGDYVTAIDAELNAQQLLWTAPLAFEEAEFHYYGALTRAACCDRAPDDQRKQHFEALTAHHRQLETWSENCPANFENRTALVGAEIARLEECDMTAMRRYEQAIQSARKNGFVQNEGLACELAAHFCRSHGFDTIADAYLRDARVCYARWGADGKVRQLEQQYPHLVETGSPAPTVMFTARAEQLDLLAVIKASRAISREILLPNLQETLMHLAMEQAGAQRGLLLLDDDGTLTIHARAEITGDETQIEIVPSLPVSATIFPLSLLNYIRHTGETVVLADAAAEDRFADDTYITHNKPRSTIGLPIVRQTRMVGLLYLENNLAAGAFTPNRLAALELLAAQAAVSLETARLYADVQHENAQRRRAEEEVLTLNRELEQRVLDRTAQLEAANKELETFTYSVSHDLRAPLRAITGFTEILTSRHRENLNDEARHYLDRISRAGDRMEQLINDLLVYSRLGQVEIRLRPVALEDIFTPLAGEFAGEVKEIGGTLEIADNLPAVMGERTLLTQIFTNLLDNAFTYRRADVSPRVNVTCETEDRAATIRVRDNGIGIPREYHEKIFDIFQRLHSVEDYPGTGIGLATVKKSVGMLGGELWLESEEGKGSSFFIRLPRG